MRRLTLLDTTDNTQGHKHRVFIGAAAKIETPSRTTASQLCRQAASQPLQCSVNFCHRISFVLGLQGPSLTTDTALFVLPCCT